MTVAVSVFGEPALQALLAIEPRVPWVGDVTIAKVNSHVSGSLPPRLTVPAVSYGVVLLAGLAVGIVFAAGGVTVRLAVAGGESVFPSFTL